MKKTILAVALISVFTVASPLSVMAQPIGTAGVQNSSTASCANLAQGGLAGVVGCIIGVFNDLVVLMMAAAVVFIVWGAFEMIYSEEKREAGRQRIYNGVIGLFVMISIWGFVNILNNTFKLRGTPLPPPVLDSKAS